MNKFKGVVMRPVVANIGITDEKEIFLQFLSEIDDPKKTMAYLMTTESARSLSEQLQIYAEKIDA